ncbi:APC family permease [Clostridium beijerinckii]|uniref:Amino acid transporter n=1 Tax=Clostridium beijerinckii TaxID=1520 RepID=A0AAE5H1T6_CLOBE|nr:APC family permease [Clostridium beijerinckii]NSB12888.1 amino acid transporter [Clostridium beijerinckii]OOM21426.1 putative amino acid permease YhdG [Clostridium beijerinckii]
MEKSGLKKDNLSIIETVALSVAIIAPTAAMSLNISLMAQTCSFSAPLVFLISTIVVGLVSYSIIKFNHYISASGSLYAFTKTALGNKMGFTSGWALLLAYIALAGGTAAGFGNFFSGFLSVFGFHVNWMPISIIASIAMIALGIIDAKICNRIILVIEGISILLILLLSVVILIKVGTTNGLSLIPFKSNGVSTSALASTSVFAFLSFIGFESASSLGEETKNPKKFIPIAIISAVFLSGLFYLVCSYAQVIGFGLDAKGLEALSSSTLPLSDLSTKYMTAGFGTILMLVAACSNFSCALGSYCAGSRMLFALGRDGIMPKAMMKIHPKHNTPYFGLILIIIISDIVQIALFKHDGIEVFGYLATIGSLAILVSYIFTSIGAMVYFTRNKVWGKTHLIIPIASIAALLYVLYSNVYPIPGFPNNLFPYIVLAWIVIGFAISNIFGKSKIKRDEKREGYVLEVRGWKDENKSYLRSNGAKTK